MVRNPLSMTAASQSGQHVQSRVSAHHSRQSARVLAAKQMNGFARRSGISHICVAIAFA